MGRESWKAGNMLYPLPAVMVTCGREGEKPNIITVAWAGTVCTAPAMVSISVRPERYSYEILRETGEFVINLTTEPLAWATDFCGVRSGRDTDKFRETGLTALPAVHVKAPLIAESPVNIECRVSRILELGSHHMFLAEVLGVDVDERYLDEKGKFCLNQAELMVYSHGSYFSLGETLGSFGYSVRRPQKHASGARKQRDEQKTGEEPERRGKAPKEQKRRITQKDREEPEQRGGVSEGQKRRITQKDREEPEQRGGVSEGQKRRITQKYREEPERRGKAPKEQKRQDTQKDRENAKRRGSVPEMQQRQMRQKFRRSAGPGRKGRTDLGR